MHSFDSLFQFTPLREGRPGTAAERLPLILFNSRPSARGDVWALCCTCATCCFQFTPLREGRRWRGAPGIAREIFNSRPSARGDCKPFLLLSAAIVFQFTPLREGRHGREHYFITQSLSIHAPPRGATAAQMFQAFLGSYFNSRPSARGDAAKARRMARRSHFNSRPSARGDVSKSGALVMNEISIHAPPRGATARPSCR